jgi:hypothetical protein
MDIDYEAHITSPAPVFFASGVDRTHENPIGLEQVSVVFGRHLTNSRESGGRGYFRYGSDPSS